MLSTQRVFHVFCDLINDILHSNWVDDRILFYFIFNVNVGLRKNLKANEKFRAISKVEKYFIGSLNAAQLFNVWLECNFSYLCDCDEI